MMLTGSHRGAAVAAAALLAAVAVTGVAAAAAAAPQTRKNVLFFAVDDLRTQLNYMGGHPEGAIGPTMHTPHIDSLASESLRLRRAAVQQAVCSPTRSSLLTGRRPDTTGIYDLYSYFRTVLDGSGADVTTIPGFFKQQGYSPVRGMGKLFHPGHASQACKCKGCNTCSDDGNHSWTEGYFHAPDGSIWSGSSHKGYHDGASWAAVPESITSVTPLPDTQIAQEAVAALNAVAEARARGDDGSDTPFFIGVGFHKPHLPFIFPEKYLDLYPASEVQLPLNPKPPTNMPEIAWSSYGEIRQYSDIAALNASGAPGTDLPDDTVMALRRAYYAATSFTDDNIGTVLQALRDAGLANDTVVSFWGDHGWQLGEHGEWCKHTDFRLATHAPMLIKVPGVTDVAGGIDVNQPTEYVDLFPTLAEAAAGVKLPLCPEGAEASRRTSLCTEGQSLVPLMADNTTVLKTASFSQYPRGYKKPPSDPSEAPKSAAEFSETLASLEVFDESVANEDDPNSTPTPSVCLTKKCTMGYSMVTDLSETTYRFTLWVTFNSKVVQGPDWSAIVGGELYDHDADIAENTNLYYEPSHSSTVAALSQKLQAGWRAARVPPSE